MRPGLGDSSDSSDELSLGAGTGEGGEKGTEVEVMEVELGAAVGIGRIDPLAAAEEPVSSIADSKYFKYITVTITFGKAYTIDLPWDRSFPYAHGPQPTPRLEEFVEIRPSYFLGF